MAQALVNGIEKYVINTQLWVSICFTALALFYQKCFLETPNYLILIFLFFVCLGGYNFLQFNRSWNWKNLAHKPSFYAFFISSIICGILSFYLFDVFDFVIVAIIGTISLLYNFSSIDVSLRKIPLLKIFLIAIVWSFFLVYINLGFIHLNLFIACVLFIIALTLPFDIKDIYTDSLTTIPKVIGVFYTKIISALFLILSFIIFHYQLVNQPILQLIILAVYSIAILLIFFLRKNSSGFYVKFWVEGISFCFIIIYCIFNFLN